MAEPIAQAWPEEGPSQKKASGTKPDAFLTPDTDTGTKPDAFLELFDSHAHLQDSEAFSADELPAVLARARAAGVSRIILPASSLDDADAAAGLARQYPGLFYAAGCHPHEASGFTAEHLDRLRSHAGLRSTDASTGAATASTVAAAIGRLPLVAIGEVGLDYHYDFSPRSVQQSVFEQQLEVAFDAGLPLIIHEREATADCLAILRSFSRAGRLRPAPGVFHCYSGSVETARELLKLGFYLGFDGPITFKNAHKPLEVIRACPSDRLLIETDSPYLTPVPYRGKRNEPQLVRLVAERMAQEIGLTLSATAALTTANACRCFGLDSAAAPRLQTDGLG